MHKFDKQKRHGLIGLGKVIAVINFLPIVKIVNATTSKTTTKKNNIKGSIIAMRLWPAADYSRITIESREKTDYQYSVTKNGEQLNIELENVEITKAKFKLDKDFANFDPFIKSITGKYLPKEKKSIIKITLKQKSAPRIFDNPPVASYRHRLFIDIYPQVPVDPLQTLIELNDTLDKLDAKKKSISKDDDELANMLSNINKKTQRNQPIPSPGSLDALIDEKTKTAIKTPIKKAPTKKKTISAPYVKKSKRRLVVVLDPGHGGEDPGAVGLRNTYEKNVVLQISKYAKKELEQLGFAPVLTRDSDFFIPLRKRVQKARSYKADLFISVHADAFTRRGASGSSIYILSEKRASSSAAKWLAKKENSADAVGGISYNKDRQVSRALQDLVQSRGQGLSITLAKNVLGELGKINRLHKTKLERASFAVLKAAEIPSALIETAFISNPAEERRLNNKDYQKALASAIARGVFRYAIEIA